MSDELLNSITKIDDYNTVDIILVRAISWKSGLMSIYMMNHEKPIVISCEHSVYLNFYTKWRKYAQWRLQIMFDDE